MLRAGQQVRVNLAGMRVVGSVVFHAAVTDAVGTIVRQVSENPPTYLVKLLFSFRRIMAKNTGVMSPPQCSFFAGGTGSSPSPSSPLLIVRGAEAPLLRLFSTAVVA
jgi:hypothetical protein